MTIYLLHIHPAFKHAQHYVGWTPDADPARRVGEHLAANGKASPLIKAALQAGHDVYHVATIPGASRDEERRIKKGKNASRYCPLCRLNRSVWRRPTDGEHRENS